MRINHVFFVKKTWYPKKVLGFKYQFQFSLLYIFKKTLKMHVKCQVNVEKKLISMIFKKNWDLSSPMGWT